MEAVLPMPYWRLVPARPHYAEAWIGVGPFARLLPERLTAGEHSAIVYTAGRPPQRNAFNILQVHGWRSWALGQPPPGGRCALIPGIERQGRWSPDDAGRPAPNPPLRVLPANRAARFAGCRCGAQFEDP